MFFGSKPPEWCIAISSKTNPPDALASIQQSMTHLRKLGGKRLGFPAFVVFEVVHHRLDFIPPFETAFLFPAD